MKETRLQNLVFPMVAMVYDDTISSHGMKILHCWLHVNLVIEENGLDEDT